MMHCRSFLLLDKELHELQKEPLWGISVYRVPSAPLLCLAVLSGLKESVWEGGKFHATLRFSEHFDEELPEVTFNTIPFHPNVDPTSGKVCVNFTEHSHLLNEKAPITVTSILLNVQSLLSNPVLTNPVNSEAAALLQNTPNEYNNVIKHCVAESTQVQEILHDQFLENFAAALAAPVATRVEIVREAVRENTTQAATVPSKANRISFDVYRKAWMQVATTKPISRHVESEDDRISLQMWKQDLSEVRSITPASAVRFNLPRKSSRESSGPDVNSKLARAKQKKVDRIEAMKQLYLNHTSGTEAPAVTATPSASFSDFAPVDVMHPSPEAWEQETDELLAWTDGLNENAV